MTALTIAAVTKSFGETPVLKGVDLIVPDRSITAILGPSGCGKTTLLRLIAGFDVADSGSISFGDRVVAGPHTFVSPQKRRVGYVPQEGALFPHLSVSANVTFGLPRRERNADRVSELLRIVDLDTSLASRYPHQLSGGQQQRVALARALAPSPELILLDEPFASLDAALRAGTGRSVASALRASNATAVLVTHDQDEALSLADHVGVMRDGRVAQIGSPSEIYRNPIDVGVAEFVGAAIVLPAVITATTARTVLGDLTVTGSADADGDGQARVLIRPEQLRLRHDDAAGGPTGQVTDVSYYGHDAAVSVVVPGADLPVVARVLGEQAPAVGSRVGIDVAGPVIAFPVN